MKRLMAIGSLFSAARIFFVHKKGLELYLNFRAELYYQRDLRATPAGVLTNITSHVLNFFPFASPFCVPR